MATRIRVIAAAAVLRTPDGGERYLYRDAVVPHDGFDEKSIEHAVSVNLVELVEVEDPIELVKPDDAPQFTKALKLAQIAAQLEARKTEQ